MCVWFKAISLWLHYSVCSIPVPQTMPPRSHQGSDCSHPGTSPTHGLQCLPLHCRCLNAHTWTGGRCTHAERHSHSYRTYMQGCTCTCARTHIHARHTYKDYTHKHTHTHSNYKKRTHNKTYALTFATEVPIKADTTSVFAIHSRIYNNNNKMYCDNSDCRV